jgi:hypothetical protein
LIAGVQESANSHRREAYAALDGNTAMAGMLGDTGEMLAQANNLSGVENQNVGIVNQAYSQNAQMENREIEMNANSIRNMLRSSYAKSKLRQRKAS